MNILLTGAFGNIGSSTLTELLRQGHKIRCFDIQTGTTQQTARHFANEGQVEVCWGDLRSAEQVAAAVVGQEIILHFGAILPPEVDKDSKRAYDVNVNGTSYLLDAACKQEKPPKFLLASSLDVFGYTQDQEPPRKITDPIQATDTYTGHKIECEAMLKTSGLEWAIYRFADVPPFTVRKPDPIMFRIPLATRFEMIHTYDAGLAVANGIMKPIWGQTWLIGGGKSCQVYYRDYLNGSLAFSGVGVLPENAFGHDPYCTDWLDTSASQQLLDYQRHSFNDIMHELAEKTGPSGLVKAIMPLIRPLVRASILKMSPYYKK